MKPLWFAGLFLLGLAAPAVAQQDPPFQQLDANTGATTNARVFVGLFTPSATGATAVALPTTLGAGGGFQVDCVAGCSGGTTDDDDASIATGQTTKPELTP